MNAPTTFPALDGMRVFVVEDEALVGMLLEDMLEEMGCVVVDLAGTIKQALMRLEAIGDSTDAAILDVNIGGEPVFPVADVLADLGIPFLFASGYGPAGVDGRYKQHIVLTKPYAESALADALAKMRSEKH
jgi:CheY-like chemotaxis protein